jgi:hypothetical protein
LEPIGINASAIKVRSTCAVKANPKYDKESLDCCREDTSFVDDQFPAPDCGKGFFSESSVELAITMKSAIGCSKGFNFESTMKPIVVITPLDNYIKGYCSEPISTPSDRKSLLDRYCSTKV